jgi:glycosyltransferase involved in cell wall biosynthesis
VRSAIFATYVSPFPTNSGERIRSVNLIAALGALGYRVDAIVGNYDRVDFAAHEREGVRFHQIPFAWPRLRQSPDVYLRAHRGFLDQIRNLVRTGSIDAIVLDYGFLGAQIDGVARLGFPVVLGTHNVESQVTAQVPRRSPLGAFSLVLRGAIEAAHERRFFHRADAVICVSDEDLRRYAAFVPSEKLFVVPNFIDIPDAYHDVAREPRIIMTGSFGNFQNVEGLGWFMDAVWDDTLARRVRFCIAGRGAEAAARRYLGRPGVEILGERDDLVGEIARSCIAIVPLRHGSGTRFKCIEAMAARTPIVTTAKGCEGIAHDGAFRVADDPAAFRAAIHDLLDWPDEARRRAEVGRHVYDRRFSLQANACALGQALDHAIAARRSTARMSPRREPRIAARVL